MSRAATSQVEEMLPVRRVAELWHCSRDHVYELIAGGHLRAVNVAIKGSQMRVPASAIAEYVRKNSRPVTA